MASKIDFAEVSKHSNKDSCWVILYNKVYNVTDFLPSHPGGAKTILRLAGKDATESYDPVHPPGTLESSLSSEACLGEIDASTLPQPDPSTLSSSSSSSSSPVSSAASAQLKRASVGTDKPIRPHPASLLNLNDIEAAAQPLLSKKAWAYYYSAADDLLSKSLNNAVYQSILLRPRVFVDCTRCDSSTTLLSKSKSPITSGIPLFVSPAAMARLAHPSGEQGIAQACAKYGVTQIISNNASMTPEQIVEGAADGQTFGWQLYVQTERRKSEEMLRRIAKLAQIKFIVLTLDAPVPGKREDDERSKIEEEGIDDDADTSNWQAAVQTSATVTPNFKNADQPKEGESGGQTSKGADKAEKKQEKGGLGKFLFAGTAADLTWGTTLPWLAKHTDLPIVLKGIQTHEDAYSASLRAPQVAGIILSNHGGRAADTAPPAIHTLLEIRKYCPEVFQRIDVYVDGGIKRGTDVVKALCLGARAVGLGRAPLYGLSVGGVAGVERVFEIMKEELETSMRLLGSERVDQLGLRSVNARQVERDIYDGGVGVLEGKRLWSKL